MTGEEAWRLLGPMLISPPYSKDSPQAETYIDAYVTLFCGCQLFDNWVAHGKPKEWQEKPKKKKLRFDDEIQHVSYDREQCGYEK